MKFPSVEEIATRDVVTIGIDASVSEALRLMIRHHHRDIVVVDERQYYLVTANDLIRFQVEGIAFSSSLGDCPMHKAPTIHRLSNVLDALEYVNQSFDYICVVDEEGELTGILSSTDVIASVDPETMIENYRLGELLKINKGVKRSAPDEPLRNVFQYLLDNTHDCVIICGGDRTPAGILTTKDMLDVLHDGVDLDAPLSSHMRSPVISINENATVKDGIEFVQQHHFRRVVVVGDAGNFIGIINQKELISMSYSKWALLMKNHQKELKELNVLLEKKATQYQKMATTDSLTGLYNRYKLDELFQLEHYTMSKKGTPLCAAVLDIDHFKKINDTYGHDAGDLVLKRLSNLLLKELRSADTVARWGGEEFVMLLSGVTIDVAVKVLDKIREEVNRCNCDTVGTISVSIGVTEVGTEDSFVSVFSRADKALYEAKRGGRNRVVPL